MNVWTGSRLRISIFGESHGAGIGCIVDGLPAGTAIDRSYIRHELDLRKPHGGCTTARQENDSYTILSGVTSDITNGAPLCVFFPNTDVKSSDYNTSVPRPAHADFPAYVKYGGKCDLRGGGHFSARLTAPLVFCGAICKRELEHKGIRTAVSVRSVGTVKGKSFYDVKLTDALFEKLDSEFPLIDDTFRPLMQKQLDAAKADSDSIGGSVEYCIQNLPIGLGEPFFASVESKLAELLFSIPAVKGIEFGKGFELCEMRGSAANDEYDAFAIKEKLSGMNNCAEIAHTNNAGGITGGLTNSMPLIFHVAFKPIPSVGHNLKSVDMQSLEPAIVKTEGRHDVCAALRGAFAVRSVACICIWDFLFGSHPNINCQ